ncbi:fasciclin-2-like isoform X2 [Belonocnema kinseyi]|uniref:fasciclin-2-like isoform X2 n=1 Tax=Belonocnema kinseyi TaxID=2817044 RepID=UPI00143D97B2|nr:fasciclin-2-like isoform X2 [Belonocnema kinseyi]
MAASWHSAAAVILVLLHLAGYSNASESLEILPSGDIQSRSIGSSIILTCRPKVENPSLISHMEWVDPQNRVIDDAIKQSGNAKSTMYTESRAGNILALLFTNLQEEQGGKYTCRATYANTEKLEKSVTIDTIVSIAWDDAPLNQYPILGEDFNIKCKVRARPSPSVDWLKNGDLITGSNDHYIIDTYALKLKKVTEDDDGIYTCRASVPTTGELKERNIRVEVHIKPVIEELDSTIEIVEGETTDIVCKARGKPPPKFTWVKSITHQDLSTADRFAVNKDTGVMSIRNVNREDDGEYQCTAANAAGTANMNIRLNVIVKPKIMEFINKTIPVSRDLEIICKAFGRPPPEILFRKHTSEKRFVLGGQPNDDRIILENHQDDRNGETVGILTIRNVIRTDDGLYECIGKNKGGTSYKNGHLTVEFPPSFEATDNRTVFAWDKHPGNLTCIATSIPNATIEWRLFGGQRLESSPQIEIRGNGPISSLIVYPMDNRFFNTYKCIASNIHGTKERSFVLKEGRRPGQLSQVRIVQMTATTVSFDLVLPPQQDELPIRRISVQYKLSDQGWDKALNRTWTVANSTYILERLEPERNYDFRFAPGNEVGLANWGNQITESTQPKSRPEIPKMRNQNAHGGEYEMSPFSNQYEVAWLLPPDNGEPITHFEITYCPLKRIAGEWEEVPNSCKTEIEKGQRTVYWLKFLSADTYYKIEVRARNVFGLSEPGFIRIKTSRGQDPPVVHHQGTLITSGAIIGIVVAVLVVIIIVIDVICCCAQKTGIIFYMCERSRRKPVDEEDAKLGSLYGWRFPLPYCDQKMANVAGVTAIQDSDSGKSTIRLVKHTAIDEKEPLREEKKITPIIDSGLRRETSITFDGKRSISKTGFIGKDSAV